MKCKTLRDIFILVGFLDDNVYLRKICSIREEEDFQRGFEELLKRPLIMEQLFVVTKERFESAYFTEKKELSKEEKQKIRLWYLNNKRLFSLKDLELVE